MISVFKNLVIAEDDRDDIELFKDAAEDACPKLNIKVARDGIKLMTLLNEIPKPDVIVMGLSMPKKSGKECLREIRAKDEFNDVSIIILSTSNIKEDIEYCLKKGANRYWVKPTSLNGMKSIVTTICSGTY